MKVTELKNKYEKSAAMGSKSSETVVGGFFSENEQTLRLRVNGYELDIALDKNEAYYDVKTLNTEFMVKFELMSKLPVSVYIYENKLSPNAPSGIKIDRIAYDKVIPVRIEDGTETRMAYIRTLNSNIPTYTTAGEITDKKYTQGYYYITHLLLPVMLKLNQRGEIVYYLCANEYMAKVKGMLLSDSEQFVQVMSYWDFKRHDLEGGKVRYSYHEQNPAYNRLNFFGYAGGCRVIMDEQYNVINRITMKPTNPNNDVDPSLNAVDGHDFYMFNDNHYILSGYELKLVHNIIPPELNPHPQGSKVIASHIQEVKEGKVVFNWYSTDYPELYELWDEDKNEYDNKESQQFDYAHFNSMDIHPDGSLVCSFRHLCTILKIDRNNGKIIWKLSGRKDEFGLSEHQKTSRQHYVYFIKDGDKLYLTLFDNNYRYRESRVIKLRLDEQNKKLLEWKAYKVPGHYSEACGSAMYLGNEVFVIG